MSRVGFDDLYFTLLSQKLSRAFGIAIAAPHGVSLARQQLCQQRAGAAHTQNEDPHRLRTFTPSTHRTTAGNAAAAGENPKSAPVRWNGRRYAGPSGILAAVSFFDPVATW